MRQAFKAWEVTPSEGNSVYRPDLFAGNLGRAGWQQVASVWAGQELAFRSGWADGRGLVVFAHHHKRDGAYPGQPARECDGMN